MNSPMNKRITDQKRRLRRPPQPKYETPEPDQYNNHEWDNVDEVVDEYAAIHGPLTDRDTEKIEEIASSEYEYKKTGTGFKKAKDHGQIPPGE